MKINDDIVTTPVLNAATVVMIRDSLIKADSIEVFLMQRNQASDVFGGAFVFPGGKVDSTDNDLNMDLHLEQPLSELQKKLNEDQLLEFQAGGLYVAALREAFEECGILFAKNITNIELGQARKRLKEGQGFSKILTDMQLCLQTSSVVPWSRWITPRLASLSSKRFDTRFFIATAIATQKASHDNYETTNSVWIDPKVALKQYWDGEILLAPPQIMSLVQITHHQKVQTVMTEARSNNPALIEPEPFDDEGTRVICYPGDRRHSLDKPLLHGPTRLIFRNNRFEPEGGFEALFS